MPESREKIFYQHIQRFLNLLLTETCENDLTNAIRRLCQMQFVDKFGLVHAAHEEKLLLMQSNWSIGLLWVLQKQSQDIRRNQHPFNHPHFEIREPFGAWLNAEYQLWRACFDFADTFSESNILDHQSATESWFVTTLERIMEDWNHSLLNQRKRDRLEQLNEELKLLSDGINPFSADASDERQRYNLINLALAIATPKNNDNNKLKLRRKQFRDFTWKSYIDARWGWAKRFSSEAFKITRLTEEKFEVVLGGRQSRTLYPAPTQSFLKQSRKKKSLTIGSA